MSQEHSTIKITPSASQESGLPKRIDNSIEIGLGLNQLQAVGDLMSACSDENMEDGTIVHMGQLIRDKAEEIKLMWEEEDESRMCLIRELERKVREAKQEASQRASIQ